MQDVSEIKHIKIQVDSNLQWLHFCSPLASISFSHMEPSPEHGSEGKGPLSSEKYCHKAQEAQFKEGSFPRSLGACGINNLFYINNDSSPLLGTYCVFGNKLYM